MQSPLFSALFSSSFSSALFSRKSALALVAGAAFTLGIAAVPAHAQTQATDRTGISGGSVIDWNQTGAEGAQVASPTTITDTAGDSATVSNDAGNSFLRLNQSSGWSGDFAPNDALLWNQGNGPITFSFASGVSGLGTQIEADNYGSFTAQLQTFDQNGALLSTFSTDGTTTSHADNSAVFLGVMDPTADIYKATFSLTAVPGGDTRDFAINGVSVASAPVPEASTTVSLGLPRSPAGPGNGRVGGRGQAQEGTGRFLVFLTERSRARVRPLTRAFFVVYPPSSQAWHGLCSK